MSNALMNLRDMTMTYGFVIRLLVMWWSKVIIAAAGDPVGLNANWSENDNEGGGTGMLNRGNGERWSSTLLWSELE